MNQPSPGAPRNPALPASARPSRRVFDREAGVLIAKNLFHERGYDAVGVSELVRALDINPPSLYAAYGSKAGLFERCLAVYVAEGNLPADRILTPDRPLHEAVQDLLLQAAALYTKSKTLRGCMAAEGMRADDPQVRALARAHAEASGSYIERYIRRSQPQRARELADYVVTILQGLSASSRAGLSRARVTSVARLAGRAFETFLYPTGAA